MSFIFCLHVLPGPDTDNCWHESSVFITCCFMYYSSYFFQYVPFEANNTTENTQKQDWAGVLWSWRRNEMVSSFLHLTFAFKYSNFFKHVTSIWTQKMSLTFLGHPWYKRRMGKEGRIDKEVKIALVVLLSNKEQTLFRLLLRLLVISKNLFKIPFLQPQNGKTYNPGCGPQKTPCFQKTIFFLKYDLPK